MRSRRKNYSLGEHIPRILGWARKRRTRFEVICQRHSSQIAVATCHNRFNAVVSSNSFVTTSASQEKDLWQSVSNLRSRLEAQLIFSASAKARRSRAGAKEIPAAGIIAASAMWLIKRGRSIQYELLRRLTPALLGRTQLDGTNAVIASEAWRSRGRRRRPTIPWIAKSLRSIVAATMSPVGWKKDTNRDPSGNISRCLA
jgi:hypothetical protein